MIELQEVSDPDEIARTVNQQRTLICPVSRDFSLLRRKDWTAVPVESSLHLSALDVRRIHLAFTDGGFEWVYAVALEALHHIAPLLRVSNSVEGLMAFNRKCAHFNYVLCPADMSSAVICSATGDYLMMAGPANFVETVVGKPLKDAVLEFRDFANDPALSPSQRDYFALLLTTVCDEYPETPEGRAVFLLKPTLGGSGQD
jgi:hypothetical protein